jgi:hypothetical protein
MHRTYSGWQLLGKDPSQWLILWHPFTALTPFAAGVSAVFCKIKAEAGISWPEGVRNPG